MTGTQRITAAIVLAVIAAPAGANDVATWIEQLGAEASQQRAAATEALTARGQKMLAAIPDPMTVQAADDQAAPTLLAAARKAQAEIAAHLLESGFEGIRASNTPPALKGFSPRAKGRLRDAWPS